MVKVEGENKGFCLMVVYVFNKEGIFPPFLYVQHFKFGKEIIKLLIKRKKFKYDKTHSISK